MRNSLFLLGFFSLLIFNANSQNLVPNPGFETPNTCPGTNGFTALDWYNPNTATPDYFTPCGLVPSTVPPNVLFGPQYPHSGTSFAGAGWYGLGGGFYDYIQVKLTSSLTAGATYSVSMWVSLADGARKASDDVGIYFSTNQFKSTNTNLPAGFSVVPTTPTGFGVFNFTPQVKCANNNFITDTIGWTLVSGTYTASGGEEVITLGCFEPWATTGILTVNAAGNDRAYYYFDDVSVELMSSPVAPAQPLAISGPSNACSNGSQNYSVAPVAGAATYSWNLPSGWTGTSLTNTITVTTTTNGGLISVTASNTAGSSVPQTLSVSVYNFQVTHTQVNSSLQTTVSGTYAWVDCANNFSVLSTAGATFTPAQSGNYAVIVNQNGCIATSACSSITIIPVQPGNVSGSSTVCANSVQAYSIAPVAGATSYVWNLPPGWTGFSITNAISVTVSPASGTLSVSAVNAAGQSPAELKNITVNGVTAVVTETNGVLYSTPAGSYSWLDCNANYSVVSTAGNTFAPVNSGSYAVLISENGCVDTSACTPVVIVPLQPGAITGPPVLCARTAQLFSIAPVTNATSYAWNLPQGWTGSSTSNSILVTANATSGTVTVTAGNSAGQSPVQIITITVNSVTATVTQSNGMLYSNTATTYTWLDCNSAYAVVASGNATFTPANSGSYAVLISTNGCVDTSACMQINIIATSLAELANDAGFTVFPNPANENLFIRVTTPGKNITAVITDYTGKTIYKNRLVFAEGSSVSKLSLQTITPGIYFIRLHYPDKTTTTKKIIIE